MIVLGLFLLLSALVLVGAGGVLLHRRPLYSALSFLLCCLALSGLYLLLNMQFLAVIQLAVHVCLAGLVILGGTSFLAGAPARRVSNQNQAGSQAAGQTRLLASFVGLGIVFPLLLVWIIIDAPLAEPVLSSLPIWVAPGGHVSALGEEWAEAYSMVFVLLGLLLLAGMVSTVYLLRQRSHP